MAVKTMVDRRNMLDSREDPSRLIAYTAHDLMTPLVRKAKCCTSIEVISESWLHAIFLTQNNATFSFLSQTGVQLSLSLLAEDEDVTKKLQPHQTELLTTASTCSDLMIRICETAIGSLRQHNRPPQTLEQQQQQQQSKQQQNKTPDVAAARITRVKELVKSLQMIMDPIPKKVPLILSLDPTVPRKIFADDLKLFRSALNLVSNATDRTTHGKVHLRIYARRTNTSTTTNTSSSSTSSNTCSSTVQQHHANQDELVFECEDTGKDIPGERRKKKNVAPAHANAMHCPVF